ncbi:MAG: hypothetical protein LBD41_05505 [Clostridiales Family XIII bacterium]|jgi:hypothetical protein|nr:hypothetical protein [Clostridiales Family XIII bacterium]
MYGGGLRRRIMFFICRVKEDGDVIRIKDTDLPLFFDDEQKGIKVMSKVHNITEAEVKDFYFFEEADDEFIEDEKAKYLGRIAKAEKAKKKAKERAKKAARG